MPALMRWVGYLAVGILVLASAAMNYLFASSLGRSVVEAQVLGVVSVAVDALKAVLIVSIASAVRHKRRTFALVASIAFAVFTLASLLAAMGFVASNRTSIAGAGETLARQLAEVEADIASMKKQLNTLPDSRPKGVLIEALRGAQEHALWTTSRTCRSAVTAAQKAHCESIRHLKVELAARDEADRLDNLRRELQARAIALRDKGAAIGGDPQARWLAGIVGADESTVQRLLMVLPALVVELASGFGAYLVTGHEPARGPTPIAPALEAVEPVSHKVSAGGALIVPAVTPAPPARPRPERRNGQGRAAPMPNVDAG